MRSQTRLDIRVNGLITFSGEKTSRATNFSDEPTSPVDSTLYLYRLDESEVIRCCALLAYQLRLKHNVIYAFNPEELSDEQKPQFALFHRLSSFSAYLELCKSFITAFRRCSDQITARFSQESASRQTTGASLKRQADGTPVADSEQDAEFKELQSVYEQMQNMKKMFDFYFNIFDGNESDRYLIYQRLYIDTCLSADIPLTMQLSDFTDLPTLFGALMRLTLISTDFANTQFSAFFGTGLLLIMLLYLTSDDVLRDVNIVTRTDTEKDRGRTGSAGPYHWTRLTLLNPADRQAACLLRDTSSESYLRAIANLPKAEFDAQLGHVYMSKGDTLATLFLQFNCRLFMRLYEWPERRDVKTHLLEYYVCDNIASYFLKSGRSKQHAWIKFFKRKRYPAAPETVVPVPARQVDDNSPHAAFAAFTPRQADPPDNLPQIFINLPALHALYDSLARGVAKNTHKRQRSDNTKDPGQPNHTDTATISADCVEVKNNWQALESFKQSYITFFMNGFALRPHFRDWYQKMATAFILRSGGYQGFCKNDHPRRLYFSDDLSRIDFPDCKDCAASLYCDSHDTPHPSAFSFEKWAKDVHAMLFPYNFLLISAAFLKNHSVLDDTTLRDAWVIKAQEILVSRKFSSEKCIRCHDYLVDLEKRCRLIIEEGQLKHLFIAAIEHLPFIRDLMHIEDSEEAEDENGEPMDCS